MREPPAECGRLGNYAMLLSSLLLQTLCTATAVKDFLTCCKWCDTVLGATRRKFFTFITPKCAKKVTNCAKPQNVFNVLNDSIQNY